MIEKTKKDIELNISLKGNRLNRFLTALMYMNAGSSFTSALYDLSNGHYGFMTIELVMLVLSLWLGKQNLKDVEKEAAREAEVDGFLAGFKQGKGIQ